MMKRNVVLHDPTSPVKDVLPCKPQRRRSLEHCDSARIPGMQCHLQSRKLQPGLPCDDKTITSFLEGGGCADSNSNDSTKCPRNATVSNLNGYSHPSSRFDKMLCASYHNCITGRSPKKGTSKASWTRLTGNNSVQQRRDQKQIDLYLSRNSLSCPNDLSSIKPTRRSTAMGSRIGNHTFPNLPLATIVEFQRTSFEHDFHGTLFRSVQTSSTSYAAIELSSRRSPKVRIKRSTKSLSSLTSSTLDNLSNSSESHSFTEANRDGPNPVKETSHFSQEHSA